MSDQRTKPVPEYKKKVLKEVLGKIQKYRTILVASTKGLPASQFQGIKKALRGKAEVVVAKKTILLRAITESGKGSLQELKGEIVADSVLLFSEEDPFILSSTLIDKQSPVKAKVGDILPEDVDVDAGPTDLLPGPAISELGSVGLRVAVEGGKLSIKQPHKIGKKGDKVSDNLANVMGKLKIFPMKVGLIPLVAYDGDAEKVYRGIKIDKKQALQDLRASISSAFGFAVKIGYVTRETVSYFIAKAAMEAKALSAAVEKNSGGAQ